MGIAYLQKGQNLEAVEVLNKGAMLSERDTVAVAFLGNALGKVGRIDEARDILTELKARRGKGYLSPFWLSMVHLGLGEQDQALDWLLKGYQERAGYMFLVHKYCQFDPLHNNIVFQELCRKMNLKL
jgi:serine/threonine-protein kinase